MIDEKILQKEIEKIYNKNIEIKIKWEDFRFFSVDISIKISNEIYYGGFDILINPTDTLEKNLTNICEKIDGLVVEFLRKG